MHDKKTLGEYERWGVTPKSFPHGTDEEIRSNLKKLQPNSWTLSGNKLTGMTEMGELVQFIPTNLILVGTDENGLPILKEVLS